MKQLPGAGIGGFTDLRLLLELRDDVLAVVAVAGGVEPVRRRVVVSIARKRLGNDNAVKTLLANF